MAAIKTFLIIVNSFMPEGLMLTRNSGSQTAIEVVLCLKKGKVEANLANDPLTTSVIG
jgi:hypothetical protein